MLASFQFWVPAVPSELSRCSSTKNPLLHAGRRPKGFRLALDDIKNLIDAGKEKGYLTYNEVNNLIPHDVHSRSPWTTCSPPSDARQLTCLRASPSCPPRPSRTRLENEVEASDEVELDLTPSGS